MGRNKYRVIWLDNKGYNHPVKVFAYSEQEAINKVSNNKTFVKVQDIFLI